MASKTTRSRHQASADTGLDNILENQEQRDHSYIVRCLKERPKLNGVLASMLRDGEIDRALARREQKEIRQQLGRPIGARAKLMKHVAPRVWTTLLGALKNIPEGGFFEPAGQEAMSARQYFMFCLLAMNCTEDTPLPKSQPHADFEGPLIAVFTARARNIGDRLQDLVYANHDYFGWVSFDTDRPAQVMVKTFATSADAPRTLTVLLPYAVEFMQNLTVHIVNNCKLKEVTLVDDSAGFSQLVWPLLQRQHPQHGLDQSPVPFEIPEAAAAFASIELPNEKDASPSGSGFGGAAALASPAKAPAPSTASASSAGSPPPLPMVRPPGRKSRRTS